MKWIIQVIVAGSSLALLSSGATALPLISELFYDAVGSDDGKGFVELIAAPGSDLAGFQLRAINGTGGSTTATLSLSGVVPADGIFLVADGRSDGSTDVMGADLVLDFDFQNGPDSLQLIGALGVVDALGYGVFGAGDVFAGEGSPAPDPPAGSSLARLPRGADTDDNGRDFVVLDVPTPGQAPITASEPRDAGAALAMLLGAAGLARGSRRRRGSGASGRWA